MATYNGATHLREQLGSILAQLGSDDEVVVVDDASLDNTVPMLQAWGDARMHVVLNERNLGLIRTFERALGLARGEFVFLSDQDDVWLPNKVQRTLDALQSAELVVSDCRVVDETLTVVSPSFFALRRSAPGLCRNLMCNSYLGCCIAMRRELLQVALPFPARLPMHDWWLGLVAETCGRVAFLDEALILYRRHGANASTTAQRSSASRWTQLAWRWRIASALLWRLLNRRP